MATVMKMMKRLVRIAGLRAAKEEAGKLVTHPRRWV
jgi:hypothetical protein